jgi:hypothetical protein
MIVYGDPEFQQSLSVFIERIREFATTCNPASLDQLRTLLLRCGQLEQAFEDYDAARNGVSAERRKLFITVTDLAANAFYENWQFQKPAGAYLKTFAKISAALKSHENPQLTIKVPEGFAFYALFPEQFCAAAVKWLKEHASATQKDALVIGIRSIGTTLSALIKTVLEHNGWQARRFTVRPTGDPFQREVKLPIELLSVKRAALIVDEGPGISGSSMAAVIAALHEHEIHEVSLFPGHAGDPGNAASTKVQRIWKQTPRYFVPLGGLQWNSKSLHESLAYEAQKLCGESSSFDSIEDVSAGGWRKFAFESESDWPAIAPEFERMKILCVHRNGTSVLWKFAGLGCARGDNISPNDLQGFTPLPVAKFRGFIATPWIEGTRLTQADANEATLKHIANHILRSVKSPMSETVLSAAISRLAEMLFWNTKELFGDSHAEQTRSLTDAARQNQIRFAYGDGRLAPYKWIRTASGAILKTDCGGHDCDHTMIGRQSVLWDVVGAMVEWDLNEQGRKFLLRPLRDAGLNADTEALRFYEGAYAAFRAGVMTFATQQTGDAAERARIQKALEFYRNTLQRSLTAPAAAHRTVGLAREFARSNRPSSARSLRPG